MSKKEVTNFGNLIIKGTSYYLCHMFSLSLWLHWVFTVARRLSQVGASGGYSPLQCTGFSLQGLLLLWSRGSRCMGFSSCGSVALWHVESPQTRDQTHVPCIGRGTPNHWTTREVLAILSLLESSHLVQPTLKRRELHKGVNTRK